MLFIPFVIFEAVKKNQTRVVIVAQTNTKYQTAILWLQHIIPGIHTLPSLHPLFTKLVKFRHCYHRVIPASLRLFLALGARSSSPGDCKCLAALPHSGRTSINTSAHLSPTAAVAFIREASFRDPCKICGCTLLPLWTVVNEPKPDGWCQPPG